MNKIYEQYRKKITNRERFVRMAGSRVNRIMDAVQKLGDCSNQSKFDYSNAEIKLKETRLKFKGTSGKKKEAT
jgi:hypothetical protein